MNISQLQFFLRKPLITLQTVSVEFLMHRSLILSMGVLQLFWLVMIAWTGASTKYSTILVVGIFAVTATLLVLFLPERAMQRIYHMKD